MITACEYTFIGKILRSNQGLTFYNLCSIDWWKPQILLDFDRVPAREIGKFKTEIISEGFFSSSLLSSLGLSCYIGLWKAPVKSLFKLSKQDRKVVVHVSKMVRKHKIFSKNRHCRICVSIRGVLRILAFFDTK